MKQGGTKPPSGATTPNAVPTGTAGPGKATLTGSLPTGGAPVQTKSVEPGKSTLTASLPLDAAPVQRKQSLAAALSAEDTHVVAAEGVRGGGEPLPFGA